MNLPAEILPAISAGHWHLLPPGDCGSCGITTSFLPARRSKRFQCLSRSWNPPAEPRGTRWHSRHRRRSLALLAHPTGIPPTAPHPTPLNTAHRSYRGACPAALPASTASAGQCNPSCPDSGKGQLRAGRFPLMEYFILQERLNLCTERRKSAESAASWGWQVQP